MNSHEPQQGYFGQPQPSVGDFGPRGAEYQVPKLEDLPTQQFRQLGHLGLKAEVVPNVHDTSGNPVNVVGEQVVMRAKRGERPDGTPIWNNVAVTATPDQRNVIQEYRATKANAPRQQAPNFTPKQPDFGPQAAPKQATPKVERPSSRRHEAHNEVPEDEFFENPLQNSGRRQSPAKPKLSPAAQRLHADAPAPKPSIERGAAAAVAAAEAAEQASNSAEQHNSLNEVARPNHRRK